jgi:hypothetical protein
MGQVRASARRGRPVVRARLRLWRGARYRIGGRISRRGEASAWPGSGAGTSCLRDADDSISNPAGAAAYACCTQVHGHDADSQQPVVSPGAGSRAARSDFGTVTDDADAALSWHGGAGAVRSAPAERRASTRTVAICVDAIATVIPSRTRTRHSRMRRRSDLSSIGAGYPCALDDRVTPHERLSGRQLMHEGCVNARPRPVSSSPARSGR